MLPTTPVFITVHQALDSFSPAGLLPIFSPISFQNFAKGRLPYSNTVLPIILAAPLPKGSVASSLSFNSPSLLLSASPPPVLSITLPDKSFKGILTCLPAICPKSSFRVLSNMFSATSCPNFPLYLSNSSCLDRTVASFNALE